MDQDNEGPRKTRGTVVIYYRSNREIHGRAAVKNVMPFDTQSSWPIKSMHSTTGTIIIMKQDDQVKRGNAHSRTLSI